MPQHDDGGTSNFDPTDTRRLANRLNAITDSLHSATGAAVSGSTVIILRELNLFVKAAHALPLSILSRLLDLLVSTTKSIIDDSSTNELSSDAKDALCTWLPLLSSTMRAAELRTTSTTLLKISSTAVTGKRQVGRSKRRRKNFSEDPISVNSDEISAANWEWEAIKRRALILFKAILLLPLQIIYTPAERESVVSAICSCIVELMQNKERNNWKNTSTKDLILSIFSSCILIHMHDAQAALEQNLKFFDYLAEPTAEIVLHLSLQPNSSRFIADFFTRFASTDFADSNHSKSASEFLKKIASSASPRFLLTNLIYIQSLVDCPEYSIRAATLVYLGRALRFCVSSIIIPDHVDQKSKVSSQTSSTSEDKKIHGVFFDKQKIEADEEKDDCISPEQARSTACSLLEVVIERFRDTSTHVRRKAVQCSADLLDCTYFFACFSDYWLKLCGLTALRLSDRNQLVRSAAIRSITTFITCHPFTLHGDSLDPDEIQQKANVVTLQLQKELDLSREVLESVETDDLTMETSSDMQNEKVSAETLIRRAATIQLLEKKRKYYVQLLAFTKIIQDSVEKLSQLLSSKNKTEVMDSIGFFVKAVVDCKIPYAQSGLSHMWHLIYNVRNEDHKKDIIQILVSSFQQIYLAQETAQETVKALITLTYTATLADRTCLERILGLCMIEGWISERVLQLLWSLFATNNTAIPISQRRGAALVLSWVISPSHSDSAMDTQRFATALRVFTSSLADPDYLLLSYACKIVQAIQPTATRLPISSELFTVMYKLIEGGQQINLQDISPDMDIEMDQIMDPDLISQFQNVSLRKNLNSKDGTTGWYTFAQASIRTIYLLCQQPTVILDKVIIAHAPSAQKSKMSVAGLCRFCFILGQVAIQHLVYLEEIESVYKRRAAAVSSANLTLNLKKKDDTTRSSRKSKGEEEESSDERKEKKRNKNSDDTSEDIHGNHSQDSQPDDSLENVVGTAEDMFTENLANVKELELIYGPRSLLGHYSNLVVGLAAETSNPVLKTFAATCLTQLMCVSQTFCECHLPFIDELLSKPPEEMPVILTANMMVALGDLTVSWSAVVSDTCQRLYSALAHNVPLAVKKNALMVLLHLILNGMVKVKGQLSHLALCLEDPDARIKGLTHLFFSELATKDHALANNLSDVLSHLLSAMGNNNNTQDVNDKSDINLSSQTEDLDDDDTSDEDTEIESLKVKNKKTKKAPSLLTAAERARINEKNNDSLVQRVLRTLFGFFTLAPPREKFLESLMDKLGQRFRDLGTCRVGLRTSRALMLCVTLVPMGSGADKKLKRLLDNFPHFSEKLLDDKIHKLLTEFLIKVESTSALSGPVVQEFLKKIKDVRENKVQENLSMDIDEQQLPASEESVSVATKKLSKRNSNVRRSLSKRGGIRKVIRENITTKVIKSSRAKKR